jgi:hypothetical protein
LVTIHDRHVAVHQDQVVVAVLHIVLFDIFDNHVEGVLAIKNVVDLIIDILQPYGKLQNGFQGLNIENLVVND